MKKQKAPDQHNNPPHQQTKAPLHQPPSDPAMSSTTPVILNTPYLYGSTNTATPVITSGSAPVYTYGNAAATSTPYVGGTRSFVLPGSTPVVAGSTAPVYTYGNVAATSTPYVGGTRSFVLPGSTPVVAAAPAPVVATSSATLTKSGVNLTSSSAAAPVVVPVAAPAPVIAAPTPAAAPVAPAFFGSTRSYVVPPNGYAPAAPAHVPGTRDFVLPGSAAAPAGRKLAVKVVDVTNLPNPAWDATDPYVVVRVGTAAKKTTIKEDAGANATWNETLRFDGVTATYATLEVYDENLLGDEHLGSATVSLAPGNYAIPFTTHEKKRAVLRVSISDE